MAESPIKYADWVDRVTENTGITDKGWDLLTDANLDAQTAYDEMESIIEYVVDKNASGEYVVNMNYKSTIPANESVPDIALDINSNSATPPYKSGTMVEVQKPATVTVDPTTGKATFSTTLKQGVNFVSKTVLPAIVGVSTGIALGKTIDSLLYQAAPNFWDEVAPTINPETWNNIIINDDTKFAGKAMSVIFGLDPTTAETQMYVEQTQAAYMALAMYQGGLLDEKTIVDPDPEFFPHSLTTINRETSVLYNNPLPSVLISAKPISAGTSLVLYQAYNPDGTARPALTLVAASESPSPQYEVNGTVYTGTQGVSHDNKTAYYGYYTIGSAPSTLPWTGEFSLVGVPETEIQKDKVAWLAVYGDQHVVTHPGVTPQEGATPLVIPDGTETPDDMLAVMQDQYPEMWENAVTQKVLQPDGSVKEFVFIPMPYPKTETVNDTAPISGTQTQTQTAVSPETSTETELATVPVVATTSVSAPPDTGSGESPSVVIPVGSASALWTIYNPTKEQLDSLGAWLWSSSFIDQLLKLFASPMDAIIGVHKVFATPPTSGTDTIKVGYLSSGVSGVNVVSSQYTSVDCGSVSVSEYFGNVFDYAPYTSINLFLPFIGIVKLNPADVMRSTVSIKYHVDVLTGACLAEVSVRRDGAGGVLYSYSGNCAVTYPVSSGSYLSAVSNVVTGAVAGGVTGGVLGAIGGGITGAMRSHADIDHSGGFSGNSGAMGGKIPYLIISRPQTAMPSGGAGIEGLPSNQTVRIGECSGYVKVKSCHIEGIYATEAERTEIENLLKSGIMV